MTKTVMGIDPSLNSTGYCALNAETLDFQRNCRGERDPLGLIKPKNLRGLARLAYNQDTLTLILQEFQPVAAIFEGYAYGENFKREAMGEGQGVLRLACFRLGIPVIVIAPQTLKKFVTGKGSGDKGNMKLCSYKKWGLNADELNDDEVDAYCLSMFGLTYLGYREGKTGAEKEAVATVKLNPDGDTASKQKVVRV